MSSITSDEHEKQTSTQNAGSARQATRRKVPRWLLICLAVVGILLTVGGGYLVFLPRIQPLALPSLPDDLTLTDIGLQDWQQYRAALPADPLADPQLPAEPVIDLQFAALQHAAGLALIEKKQMEPGLAYLKAAVQSDPENLQYGNSYRLILREDKRYNDEETFFAELYQQYPVVNVGIGLALSYVDQMRSCPKPPDGLVCQAQYSSRSIDLLASLLADHPYNAIARYASGLNHLYWPTLMGHLPASQKDLEHVVALAPFLEESSPTFIDDAYTALGDVFAKGENTTTAQNVWRNGLQVVPDSELLQNRLAIPLDKLVSEMDGPIRGLGVYVETDLTLFWT